MDEKLRLILVDDEHLVRELLRRCVDWDELGYEVSGEASCAQEALELVERFHPHVIFTDICMPFMDGIEFARLVVEKYPATRVVVLTGFDEFEYAKRSVKIGISDFLLKPVNDDEIRRVAVSLRERILAEQADRAEYSRLKKQLEESRPFLRERLLNELLTGVSEDGDIRRRMDYFGLVFEGSVFEVAVAEVSGTEDAGEEARLMLRMEARDMMAQYFRNDPGVVVFPDNHQRVVILSGDTSLDMAECLEAVRTLLVNRQKGYVSIGAGRRVTGLRQIAVSYREAVEAMEYRVIAGKNQIIHYSDLHAPSGGQAEFQPGQRDEMVFSLKSGLSGKAVALVDAMFDETRMRSDMRIETLHIAASNVVSVVLNVAAELGVSLQELFGPEGNPFTAVFRTDTLPEMRTMLRQMVTRTCAAVEGMQTRRVNQAVSQVQAHIAENLSDTGLSLGGTAKKFFLNQSYLSRIFKQETGLTFVEYVTRMRMEKAMRMLRETDMKAYQVAGEVGIDDPHYFGICFKKYTGLSVNEFKKG